MATATADSDIVVPSPKRNNYQGPEDHIDIVHGVEIPSASTASGIDNDNDNDKVLKRSWLNKIPSERVIDIVLQLDACASQNVKSSIWPSDFKAALLALETTADEDGESEIDIEEDDEREPQAATAAEAAAPSGLVPVVTNGLPESISPPGGLTAPSLPTSFPVPPMSSLPHTTHLPLPPTGVTPYSFAPYPPYAQPPYGNAPLPYPTHPPPYVLPYPAIPPPHPPPVPPSSSPTPLNPNQPLFTSSPLHRHPLYKPAIPAPLPLAQPSNPEEEESLPSYEVMLTHALSVHCNPLGEVPKTLFAWIAAHYPVQTNFRPSAHQALQKALKRGRFEKSKDGRYRLNHAYDGNNNARRTTRRPTNMMRAAMNQQNNLHPTTSHPPYAVAAMDPKFSASPPSAPVTPGIPLRDAALAVPTDAEREAEENREAESRAAIEAWEAAQSILQALNLQGNILQQQHQQEPSHAQSNPIPSSSTAPPTAASENDTQHKDADNPSIITGAPKPAPSAFPMPIIAGNLDFSFGSSSSAQPSTSNATASSSYLPQLSMSSRVETPSTSTTTSVHLPVATVDTTQSVLLGGRAALQGHFALLAAQLADLVGSSHALNLVPGVK